jgi:hypothetical protein
MKPTPRPNAGAFRYENHAKWILRGGVGDVVRLGALFSSAANASATGGVLRLSDAQIEQPTTCWPIACPPLAAQGVKLPQLRRADGRYTQAA